MTGRLLTLFFALCALAFAGCASPQPAQGGGGGPAPAPPVDEHPAVAVALAHYAAIEADDEAAFEASCWPSTSTQFWWTTGRRYVTNYGVHWEYQRSDAQQGDRIKLWFIRIQADGSQRGMPLPCTVRQDEAGQWVVYSASQ